MGSSSLTRSNRGPLCWELRVLTALPPRKPLDFFLKKIFVYPAEAFCLPSWCFPSPCLSRDNHYLKLVFIIIMQLYMFFHIYYIKNNLSIILRAFKCCICNINSAFLFYFLDSTWVHLRYPSVITDHVHFSLLQASQFCQLWHEVLIGYESLVAHNSIPVLITQSSNSLAPNVDIEVNFLTSLGNVTGFIIGNLSWSRHPCQTILYNKWNMYNIFHSVEVGVEDGEKCRPTKKSEDIRISESSQQCLQ